MKLSAKYWITAAVITAAGAAIMIGAAVYHWMNPNLVTNTETFSGFENLEVNLGACSLTLQSSDEAEVCTIEFINVSNEPKAYIEDGDTLVIEQKERTFNLINFGWSEKLGQVIITVPPAAYQQISLELGVADNSSISNIACNALDLDAGVGNISMSDLNVAKAFNLDGGTGDFTLTDITVGGTCDMDLGVGSLYTENFVAKQQCELDLGTGDCEFRDAKFSGLQMDCGVGEVKLLSTTLAGDADIMQGTGDLELELLGDPSQYSISSEAGMGDVTIDGSDITGIRNVNSKYEIRIECGVGDVNVTFPDKE